MPYMAELWYPEAIKDELPNAGYMLTSSWRGVLHTTEGSSYAGAKSAYVGNRSAPHFTVSFEGGVFRVRQHIPLNRAARALRNLTGGVDTNRLRCIQIEIVGFAAKPGAISGAYADGTGRLMRWIEANTEIKRIGPGRAFATAYGQNHLRFSNAEWMAFNGWCGHCHVPENDHWDPGAIDINHLLSIGVPTPPPSSGGNAVVAHPPVKVLMDPQNRGYWVITSDGGVFAYGYPGKTLPFHGSLGGIALAKPIVDAEVTPDGGGYMLMGADGGMFAFGNAQFAGRVEYNG